MSAVDADVVLRRAYEAGRSKGYGEGHADGRADGHAEGFEDGFALGRSRGRIDRRQAASRNGDRLSDPLDDANEGPMVIECARYLRNTLDDGPRPMRREVTAECNGLGYSTRTVERARSVLGVEARKAPGRRGASMLSLPQ